MPFLSASTELVYCSGMTTTEINTFLGLCQAQNMTELTVREYAMTYWTNGAAGPPSSELNKIKAVITTANSLGIDVNVDMHTWYTTWTNNWIDTVSGYAAKRATYIDFVEATIDAFAGYNVKAWQVMNEPTDFTVASASENQFILDVLTAAHAHTDKPVSVRFAGGYNPQTGYFSDAIDVATDYLCRNSYWDPRNPTKTVYGCSLAVINHWIADAATLGKELWITEFGVNKSNQENQRAYIAAWIDFAETNGIQRMFGWCCDPDGGAVTNFDLFNGYVPRPAFYELVSSGEGAPETHVKTFSADSWLQDNNTKAFTADAWLVDQNSKSFTADVILDAVGMGMATFNADAWLVDENSKSFTADVCLEDSFSKSFTADVWLELDETDPYPLPTPSQSIRFSNAIATLEAYSGIKQLFQAGMWPPGMDNFECPMRTAIKTLENIKPLSFADIIAKLEG